MKPRTRFLYPALATALLTACSDQIVVPNLDGPLNQQDVSEAMTDMSGELEAILTRASQDKGLVALQGFPHDSAMTNPFFGYMITLMQAKHPRHTPGALQTMADTDLPRGVYTYTESDGSEGWVLQEASDDLVLNWSYDADPTTAEIEAEDASATFDWDAQSLTAEVEIPKGETLEVPTGANFSMVAGGESVADVNADLTYYRAVGCGDELGGILEPTSLTVNGSGSLLSLENVGYTVTETDSSDTVSTQGRVALAGETVVLDWNISVEGELVREDCYTSDFIPESGTIATELSGLPGETSSIVFGFTFDGFDPDAEVVAEIRNGSLILNGDESRAVTFGGPLGDQNNNGIPGDELTIRFADGSSTTLEQVLVDLSESARSLGHFLKRR